MSRLISLFYWLVALMPLFAARYWASFGAGLPQQWSDRQALGDVSSVWQWDKVAQFVEEPFHIVARSLHLATLSVPGATMASVVWLNVLLVVLLVLALTSVCRRIFPQTDVRLVVFMFGLLAATPAFGSNWLHGERAAVLLVPMLFAAGLHWLQGERRFPGRAMLALLIAVVAPLCHTHGIVVALALIPALLGAARRAGSERFVAWLGTLMVLGTVTIVLSMRDIAAFGAPDVDWFRSLAAAPTYVLADLVRAIGSTWLDLLPSTKIDELGLGAFTLALPLLAWWLGSRDPERRAASMPFWSCYLFGVLVVVVNAIRYNLEPPVGSLREAMFGAFLLPVGVIGILATRFTKEWLTFGAGLLAVLAAQDWYLGLEDLRLARMHAQRLEASLLLPKHAGTGPELLPVKTAEQMQLLREHEWLPELAAIDDEALAAIDAAASPASGTFTGGSPSELRGTCRSSLRVDTGQWVIAVARSAGSEPKIVGNVRPHYASLGRDVDWQMKLAEPLAEGASVRVVTLLMPSRKFVPLGRAFVVKDGKLVVDN